MDFHTAFAEMDEDGSGEISRTELEDYMRKHNYAETFVQKWLNLFDKDGDGSITYEEYCSTLGLRPKKEVVEGIDNVKAKTTQTQKKGKQEKKKVEEPVQQEKMEVEEQVQEEKMDVEEPVQQEKKKVKEPVKREKKKVEEPVQQETLDVEVPVQQEKIDVEEPVRQEKKKVEEPVQQEKKKVVEPVRQEKKKAEEPVRQEKKKVDEPVQQEKKKVEEPVRQEKKKAEEPVRQEKKKVEEPVQQEKRKVKEPVQQGEKMEEIKAQRGTRNKAERPKTAAKVKSACKRKSESGEDSESLAIAKYSRSDNFRRKALYRYTGKGEENAKAPSEETPAPEAPKGRRPRAFEIERAKGKKPVRPTKSFKQHKRRLRASITAGTILILLAGPHKGKRVVFLKQLSSGLLLVTGPFKYNGVPLRRVHQKLVIATKTKVNVADVKIPDRVDDQYFQRAKKLEKKRKGDDLFAETKDAYTVSAERKEDQKVVDSQIVQVLKTLEDGSYLRGYLCSKFGLFSHDLPHKMTF